MDMPKPIFKLRKVWRNIRYSQPGPTSFVSTLQFCKSRNLSFQILEPARCINRTPPVSAEDRFKRRFVEESERLMPPIYFAELPDMYVTLNGYVFSEDGVLLTDAANEIGSSPDNHSLMRGGNLPPPKMIDATVAVLDVSHGYNYFHFLFDALPRLAFLPEEKKPDFYYVRYKKEFHKQYLNLLGIDPAKIISAEKEQFIKTRMLYLPSLPGISGNPAPESILFLRNMRDKISPANETKSRDKRIYISRRDVKSRLFANEEEVQCMLEAIGFEIVKLSDLNIIEQIELFKQTALVIAPHGAGLSNIVYADPGIEVIELFHPEYFNVCYWALAQLCGHHYSYITASTRSAADKIRSPLKARRSIISLARLEFLAKMGLEKQGAGSDKVPG